MLDLDLRSIASPRRDPTMLAAFDALKAGEEMRLTTDREPRALRGALERTRSQQYVWLQHRLGQDLWEITLRRLTAVRPERVSDLLRRSPLFADAHPNRSVRWRRSRSNTRSRTAIRSSSKRANGALSDSSGPDR